jgi:hypothetical protein
MKLPAPAKSIFCIPGAWKDFDDFKGALITSSAAHYMVLGDALINSFGHYHYSFEFCERDVRMRLSFSVAGMTTGMSAQDLDVVEGHRFVVYISGVTGNPGQAAQIAEAATAILKAGGLGIKVESTGKAFSKERWLDQMAVTEPQRLYDMFVLDSITDKDGTVFSCGMHNLGLKETIVSNEDFQEAARLIRVFGCYQFLEHPVILENQTFQVDRSAPLFRITSEPHPPYATDDTFHNPYGMWRLTRVASA